MTTRDSSQSKNEGVSVIKQLNFTDRDTIGYWSGAHYSHVDDWDMFNYGDFQSEFTYGGVNWGRVLASRLNVSDDTGDTMTYTHPLDLTGFDDVWLTVTMSAMFRDEGNYGVVEFSDDGETWTARQTFTGSIEPQWIHYDLSNYTLQDHFQFRFRIHCESLFTEWIIDDIILHSDSTVLNTTANIILPKNFGLLQNYPNPFNPVTTIRYELPIQTEVKLAIYNIMGQEMAELVNGKLAAGEYEIIWNAGNLPSGIYFYRLETTRKQITKKLVVLK